MFEKIPIRSNDKFYGVPIPSKVSTLFPDFKRNLQIGNGVEEESEVTSWLYKIVIDHNQIDSDLTHFPIPISLNGQRAYTAKSIILDIADNWGDASYMGINSVEFKRGGHVIPLLGADITCYSTSTSSNAEWAFDTSKAKTGAPTTEWQSGASGNTNQRLICVIDSGTIVFDEIVINNLHHSGGMTTRGAKNVKLYISSDIITSTVYNEELTNQGLLYDGEFREHNDQDAADDELLVLEESVEYIAKSVIFDFADTYDVASPWMGLMSVEFYYKKQLIEYTTSDFDSYQSSHYNNNFAYHAENVFDQSLAKSGSSCGSGSYWLSDDPLDTERIIIVFNSEITFDEIIVNNYHNCVGGYTDDGVKNTQIHISTDEITDTTYGASISNSTKIFNGQIPRHPEYESEDNYLLPTIYNFAELPIVEDLFTNFLKSSNTAKSVIFDIADSFGINIRIRSIEFYNEGELLPVSSSTATAYSTSQFSSYEPMDAFDTTLSKTGSNGGTEWISAYNVAYQRVIIVFNSEITFDEIIVNNSHNSGTDVVQGVKNTQIHISTDEITDTTYGASISNSIKIFKGQLQEHKLVNEVDDQILSLMTNCFKLKVLKENKEDQVYAEVVNCNTKTKQLDLFVAKSDLTLSSTSDTILYLEFDLENTDSDVYMGTPSEATINQCTVSNSIGQEHVSYIGEAFDRNLTDEWFAYDSGYLTAGWVGQNFGQAKVISKYAIYENNRTEAPKTWTFEGSETGAWGGEEVTLDTQTNYAFDATEAWHTFYLSNRTAYQYYRVNVTANNGHASYLYMLELAMFEHSASAFVWDSDYKAVYNMNNTVTNDAQCNILDSSFYSNPSSFKGTFTPNMISSGIIGNGLQLNSTDNYLEAMCNDIFNAIGTGDFTLTLAVKLNDYTAGVLAAIGSYLTGVMWFFTTTSTKIEIADGDTLATTKFIGDHKYTLIEFKRTSGGTSFSVNGDSVAGANEYGDASADDGLRIGYGYDGTDNDYLDGNIGFFSLKHEAKTDNEMFVTAAAFRGDLITISKEG